MKRRILVIDSIDGALPACADRLVTIMKDGGSSPKAYSGKFSETQFVSCHLILATTRILSGTIV